MFFKSTTQGTARSASHRKTREFGRRRRTSLEFLEHRVLMASDTFNDPDYTTIQWGLNNAGQTGGVYDIDIDAPEAWTVTTGSMNTVLAQVDDGVDFTHADIYLNIWLNQQEIPYALKATITDTDGDGLFTFRDLNNSVNGAVVSDLNRNGYIDGGDLLQDSRWVNGSDDDSNGYVDDLVGWDFVDGDNDARPVAPDGHGTGMVQWIGAIPNNGIGKVGVNHLISAMPVRVRQGDVTTVDPLKQAAGIDYAVALEAPISAVWGRRTEFSQGLYDAINRAKTAGQLIVAPAGNDYADLDAAPRYPAAYDLENIISVTAFNASDGKDPIWNWGATSVDLASPTAPGGGTSGGAAHVAGVAALLKTVHPEWNYQLLKDRILGTVDVSTSFVGKTVTGGRLNAANALGVVQPQLATKFYVVNDGSFDRTYEYAAAGDVTMSYNVGSANTAPRGAASTAAGDRVWVVDANKNIYVYSSSGTPLGSWSAGSLNGAAQVEGIATNGTDVWIVDAKSDKVFRYAGAASRVSGNQNAASSFALNKSNTNPKDVVTDGTHLWVVDDAATDKVFKYSLTGSLVGSWAINSGGGSPTGITLDPSAPNHLWIVDAASDRVYQYDGAVTRTSGSLAASTSFLLASGNTNPQGIADPPVTRDATLGHGTVAAAAYGPASQATSERKVSGRHLRSSIAAIDGLFSDTDQTWTRKSKSKRRA